jgi:sodium pump decarboxylase gamma subunit
MANSLLITGIGMGLVFVVILMLWGMMELLVRLTAEKEKPEEGESLGEWPEPQAQTVVSPAADKQKIAAIAVAAALQLRRRQAAVEAVRQALASQKLGISAPVSANPSSNWQAVMRSVQRENKQKMFSRTPRNVR